MKKLAVLAVLLLAIAGGAYLLRGEELPEPVAAWMEREELAWLNQARGWLGEATASPTPVQYSTAPVERRDIRQNVSATGTLNAVVTVEVGTQLSGQIAEIHADFNDEVKRGRPPAQLDLYVRLTGERSAFALKPTGPCGALTTRERPGGCERCPPTAPPRPAA